jgi:hypothetical protein
MGTAENVWHFFNINPSWLLLLTSPNPSYWLAVYIYLCHMCIRLPIGDYVPFHIALYHNDMKTSVHFLKCMWRNGQYISCTLAIFFLKRQLSSCFESYTCGNVYLTEAAGPCCPYAALLNFLRKNDNASSWWQILMTCRVSPSMFVACWFLIAPKPTLYCFCIVWMPNATILQSPFTWQLVYLVHLGTLHSTTVNSHIKSPGEFSSERQSRNITLRHKCVKVVPP